MTTEVERGERVFVLPDLGEGLTDAEIVEWLVAEGDVIAVDQPVANVLTEKATVEMPAPFAGRVVRCHGAVGDRVPVGAPLLTIAPESSSPSPVAPKTVHSAENGATSGSAGDSGQVLVGYGTDAAHGSRRRRRFAQTAPAGERPAAVPIPAVGHIVTTPPIRKLARERGVDLGRLSGSGPGGRITRDDVDAAAVSLGAPISAQSAENAPTIEGDEGERIPITGMRRVIAEHLTRSRREIPDATTWVDADATELVAARAAINHRDPSADVSVLALVARAVVAGLARFPELNAHVDTERNEIVRHRRVHLGIAAQTPNGLVVPVVHGADALTIAQLAAEIRRLSEAARAGRLTARELTGGTFTLNNYGVFGVDGSSPIINHPEAAILGLGRLADKPWVVDGRLAVRTVTQLSLAFDHRACDGGVAGGFLRFVADCVERPILLLA